MNKRNNKRTDSQESEEKVANEKKGTRIENRKRQYQESWEQIEKRSNQREEEEGGGNREGNMIIPTAPPIGSKRLSPTGGKRGTYEYQKQWKNYIPVGGVVSQEQENQKMAEKKGNGNYYYNRNSNIGRSKQAQELSQLGKRILQPQPYSIRKTDQPSRCTIRKELQSGARELSPKYHRKRNKSRRIRKIQTGK